MTTFDQREQAYEAKLAHDEELSFKAHVRRNKYLGLWAAKKLGMTGVDAENYANSVVVASVEGNGDPAVFRKLRADFDAAGIAQSDHQIHREMEQLLAKATTEIMTGSGPVG